MPLIKPIKELKNTTKPSVIANKEQESNIITNIDQAIFESEKEFAKTGEYMDADKAFTELEDKYYA